MRDLISKWWNRKWGIWEQIDSDFYQGDDVNEYHKSILEFREGKIFTVKELLEIFKNK
jgi:hypothetical protein